MGEGTKTSGILPVRLGFFPQVKLSKSVQRFLYRSILHSTLRFMWTKTGFFPLLAALLLLLFVPSFISHPLWKSSSIYVFLIFCVLASLWALRKEGPKRYGLVLLGSLALLFNALPLTFIGSRMLFSLRMFSWIAFFSLVVALSIARVYRARRVSVELIFGAVAVYLMLGILGGFWCRWIAFLEPNAFLLPEGMEAKLDDMTYYSFVTLTSLGFGEITPHSPAARSVTLFIAILGQMYLAIGLAILVGKYAVDRG